MATSTKATCTIFTGTYPCWAGDGFFHTPQAWDFGILRPITYLAGLSMKRFLVDMPSGHQSTTTF